MNVNHKITGGYAIAESPKRRYKIGIKALDREGEKEVNRKITGINPITIKAINFRNFKKTGQNFSFWLNLSQPKVRIGNIIEPNKKKTYKKGAMSSNWVNGPNEIIRAILKNSIVTRIGLITFTKS
ncbi:MAG: hypothetical protein ABIH20_03365 [Candidatus Diapherotrites archaeon]